MSENSVQLEDGYTRIANQILDHIIRYPLNGSQYRIVMTVWRYTYGFHRKDHDLSVEFVAQATGINDRNVRREIKNLIDQRLIIITKEATGVAARRIGFNKNYEEWSKSIERVNQPSPKNKKTKEGVNSPPLDRADSPPLERVDQPPKKERKIKENIYSQIISYLNEKAGKRFNPKVAATQKLINGRISEGRTFDDFIHVIDVKCHEWIDNQKMYTYLRPDTLFSGKNFDKYLNQPVVQEEETQQAAGYDMEYEDALREWVMSGNDPERFVYER